MGPAGGAVLCIAAAPSNGLVAYLAGDASGVFKSEDGGASWRIASSGLGNFEVRSLAVSPTNASVVLAGTDLGAFRSADGASSWTAVGGTLPADTIDAVAFDPTGATAYAVSLSGWVGRSADAGATWQTLTTPASAFRPQAVTVDPTNAARVYVGTLDNGIYRSENSGVSWTDLNANLGNLHVAAIGIDPGAPSTIYAGTNAGVFRSTDDGVLWTAVTAGAGAIAVKDLVVDANGVAYLANINGAWASAFPSSSWQRLTVPSLFANAIAARPAPAGQPAPLLVGTGNPPLNPGALWASDANGDFFVADGVNVMSVPSLAVDPASPQRVLALGTAFGAESTDGGRTFEPVALAAGFGTVIVFNPFSPGTVYEGSADGIFRSSDGGGTWEDASAGLPASVVRAILPQSASALLAATLSGVYRSSDGGTGWTAAGGTTGVLTFSLAAGAGSGKVFAGAQDGVYFSSDSGATWTKRSAGVAGPVRAMLTSSASVFAGADPGLYVSQNDGTSWTRVQGGFPAVGVYALCEDASGARSTPEPRRASTRAPTAARRGPRRATACPIPRSWVSPRSPTERSWPAPGEAASTAGPFRRRRPSGAPSSGRTRARARGRSRSAPEGRYPIASISASARAISPSSLPACGENRTARSRGDDDAALLEVLRPSDELAARRPGGEDPGGEGLGRGDSPAAAGEAVRERPHEAEHSREDGLPAHLLEEIDRGRQAPDVVDRQGPGLVAARAFVGQGPVLEVVALGLEIPPARRDRGHAVARLLRDVEDGAALRAVEPLVAVGGENVDPGAAHVRREQAETLDPVDEEEDAALAAQGADLFQREDEAVVEGDPGDGDDARARVDEGRDRIERDAAAVADGHAAVDTAALERAPG